MSWLDAVCWDEKGLVTAIAQDAKTQRVLMVAYMNPASLALTAETGIAHYFSRSRQKLWKKGEESGHLQTVSEIRLDCDGDVVVLQITQAGGIACHTGRESCLFRKLVDGEWLVTDQVLRDPESIYAAKQHD
ncbi:phosphoribosyl-AMP cyclohydrolase [Chitinimonas sp. BJB300]|uniref:phosphoribosyl-AMP cyclohydrolase n=1 Tax=Chitinimonas sp. BJB300 TaxID=1559339 RepID=UPI000C0F7AB5|nr:phosphoribosyl-AMP cyclohydrolase [Chitinimonas sp. BJB300]PHV10296.1 phosphoribosyl-AMP cyclohydrolase [Chitinimonas sp. BJB300]TSJ91546.1 phosphoribosyl-AMP cyclohydrolase [Chitinimonas sp. BJB300]